MPLSPSESMNRNDIEQLNLLPINQLAAIKLKMAGVAANPSILAVFQLMQWGLDTGVPLTHRRTSIELQRLSLNPAHREALDYLVVKVPGGIKELHRSLLRLPPRAAAELLLDVLDMRLKADPSNLYPSEDTTG
jgi:hypothetical protein